MPPLTKDTDRLQSAAQAERDHQIEISSAVQAVEDACKLLHVAIKKANTASNRAHYACMMRHDIATGEDYDAALKAYRMPDCETAFLKKLSEANDFLESATANIREEYDFIVTKRNIFCIYERRPSHDNTI